jgi:hypothetical protein
MWWFFEDSISINSIDMDKVQVGNGIGGDKLLDWICDVLIRCYSIINWGRIEVANHVAEVFIGEMEVGEFAVNAIRDGVDEVVDGIVVGKCLVRCMMWFR